ncbi:hypothetical protein [Candidatus Pyrohabitans sp.]
MEDAHIKGVYLVLFPWEKLTEMKKEGKRYLGEKEIPIKYAKGKEKTIWNFYLASPCFAKARLWIADCNNYVRDCSLSDAKNGACNRCLFVSLEKAYGLKYQALAAGHNYCAAGVGVKITEKKEQSVGLASIPVCLALTFLGGVPGALCFAGTTGYQVMKEESIYWPNGGYWMEFNLEDIV